MPVVKLDLRREFHELYSAARAPGLIVIPDLVFLMVDGKGDPNTSTDYRSAIEALYSVSFTLKFTIKRGPLAIDYPVMPLEGLWWGRERSEWSWTAMIMQPEVVTPELVSEAIDAASGKRPLAAAQKLRFEHFDEGRCAQVMHIGPYATEGPTIAALHAFIAAEGLSLTGKHHEIYLGDPRRAAPEKLRTIIRQPVG